MNNTSITITLFDNLTVNTATPQLVKQFPRAFTADGTQRLGIRDLSLYNSWFNVTNLNQNTKCFYIWNNTTVYPVVFPEGNYQISDLSNFIQTVMFANGHYLLNDQLQPVYYLTFVQNIVYYTTTLTCTPLPSTLPTGWSNPGGVMLNGLAPCLVISSDKFGALIGYTQGIYPSACEPYESQLNSSVPPVIAPITSISLITSWIYDSRFTTKPTVIASFVPNVSFGNYITYTPSILSTFAITPGTYENLDLSLVDQNFNVINVLDWSGLHITMALMEQTR